MRKKEPTHQETSSFFKNFLRFGSKNSESDNEYPKRGKNVIDSGSRTTQFALVICGDAHTYV